MGLQEPLEGGFQAKLEPLEGLEHLGPLQYNRKPASAPQDPQDHPDPQGHPDTTVTQDPLAQQVTQDVRVRLEALE